MARGLGRTMLDKPGYDLKVYGQKKFVKVVAFGSSGSGKSALIKSIDQYIKGSSSKHSKYSTTSAFDLVIVNDEKSSVYVYGTNGSERFQKVSGIVSTGMNIGLVVVDSTRNMTDFEKALLQEFRSKKVPFLVVANKIDLPGSCPENVRTGSGYFGLVLPTSATLGAGIGTLVTTIFEMIDDYGTKKTCVPAVA